ncbi:hypothetical protein Hamer_G015576 [Homarus americanus]|uniref:Uncharacterized protein n=1 Tax=Homarus americanus TaxID=6706 RepID=A0A8J5MKW7_HOMAM|nr:hypothetical protein Hamer_G015576 [Homarus americanus]
MRYTLITTLVVDEPGWRCILVVTLSDNEDKVEESLGMEVYKVPSESNLIKVYIVNLLLLDPYSGELEQFRGIPGIANVI